MEILEFAIRLSAALLFGVAIGVERQWRQKSAGLRTNTLVSLGSAAFILISASLTDSTGDPSRIAAQIVTGIGFLGAGVIMKDGLSVQGLNTAATIWCSAAVGSLCGLGLFAQAGVVTAFIMLTHILLRPVGQKLSLLSFNKTATTQIDYLFTIKCKTEVENHIRVRLMQMLGNDEKLLLKSLTSDDTDDVTHVTITAVIKAVTPQDSLMERVASRLTIEDKVIKVSWEIIGTQSEL
ncbi:MgtC/SapB family protein [Pedobacter chinensis]|uniref:Protein MgtC n=2 Tax=Sphingobacteriaceae TaxID=84566 RepID=A0A369PZ06_9SPHI|nr:MgtC/SapB family protein [Pedobacter chinensis]PZP49428.1 MAG: magnesium transporter MgtC [Pseudopedobacter saltans]RDC55318.1 MgtC/SapB family protein [Pedobacter chinensis]